MSEKKQLLLNIVANVVYMLMNYAITFFLTSYVVSEISGEAYGFISLCNNVVNYATIVTVALNSVAGRFITIHMHRGEINIANKYFSSTLIADFVICAGILAVFIPICFNLEKLFNIPNALIYDVKVMFILVTLNLLISVISSVYSVSTFITNKLYLSSLANAAGNIVRAISLTALMYCCKPSIVYVGIATVLSAVVILVLNIIYTKILCTNLKISIVNVSLCQIKELIKSGVWNSITKLSQILSDGLDLLISNIWIGAYEMGQLSIAYTIPTIVSAFIAMIINVFNPKLTEYYAKENIQKVVKELKTNMKMTGFFGNVLFFGIITMGKDLFNLWVPTANIQMIYSLVILATLSVLISAIVSPLSNVFLLTNKLKVNSIIWLCVSVFDAIIVIILVRSTSLGVYAVAGVSKIVGSIVNIVFLPLYAAHCLNVKKSEFYTVILKYFISSIIVGGMMIGCRMIMGMNNTWGLFAIRVVFLGILGMLVNFFFFFGKEERKYFINIISAKFSVKKL